MKSITDLVPLTCAARSDEMTRSQIMDVHKNSEHLGIWHTVYFTWQIYPMITKADVWSATGTWELIQPQFIGQKES